MNSWMQRFRFVDGGLSNASCVLVAGSARSGTTWIGDVVSAATKARPIFEPFLQRANLSFVLPNGEEMVCDHFQPYAPAGAEPAKWARDVDRILRGKVRHPWCDRFTPNGFYIRRVVKAVRMNLMLDYIATEWPRVKILFVVRDPRSVVNSQLTKMKQGWIMQWRPEFVLGQPQLMADWLEPYRPLIEEADDLVRQQTLKWCIENLIPLNVLPRHKNAMIVNYDRLAEDATQWSTIGEFLRDRHWRDERCEAMVHQVSEMAERSSRDIRNRVENWRELDAAALQTISDLVSRFGLSHLLSDAARIQRVA